MKTKKLKLQDFEAVSNQEMRNAKGGAMLKHASEEEPDECGGDHSGLVGRVDTVYVGGTLDTTILELKVDRSYVGCDICKSIDASYQISGNRFPVSPSFGVHILSRKEHNRYTQTVTFKKSGK